MSGSHLQDMMTKGIDGVKNLLVIQRVLGNLKNRAHTSVHALCILSKLVDGSIPGVIVC